jgi:hypothetical protein
MQVLQAIPSRALMWALFVMPALMVPAAAQDLQPVTSTMTVPWSGILTTDLENVAVSGTISFEATSIFTRKTVFTKIEAKISRAVGVGLTSGQTFVAMDAAVHTCSIPGRLRNSNSNDLPYEFMSEHRLLPSGTITSFYQQVREGSLALISEFTFQADGSLAAAVVRIGSTRFRPAATP